MNMNVFKALTTQETVDFEAWADANYQPLSEISGTWHPVIQARCTTINKNYDHEFIADCKSLVA